MLKLMPIPHVLHVKEIIPTGRRTFFFLLRGNLCTACALRATFRLCSPRRAPKHTPWKRP